jgi:hypothetical protein
MHAELKPADWSGVLIKRTQFPENLPVGQLTDLLTGFGISNYLDSSWVVTQRRAVAYFFVRAVVLVIDNLHFSLLLVLLEIRGIVAL